MDLRRPVRPALLVAGALFAVIAVIIFQSPLTVAASDGISTLQGMKLGGSMFTIVLLLSHNLGSSIEPISILFVEALISLLAKLMPEQLGMFSRNLGFMNNTTLSLVIILIFVIVKIPRSMMPTRVFGIAVEDIENWIMGAFNFALPFLVYFCGEEEETKKIITAGVEIGSGVALAGKILICVLIGTYMLLAYVIMRTVLYAGDVIVSTLSVVPFLSAAAEITKTVAVIAVVLISVFVPWLLIAIYIINFIICIILFKKAYRVISYFRAVYLSAFLAGEKKRNRIASGIRSDLEDKGETSIVCYAGANISDRIRRYSKCRLVIGNNGTFIALPGRKGKPDTRLKLENNDQTVIKIRKGMRFIEIYAEDPSSGKRIKKKTGSLSVVIGRDHFDAYEDIVRATGFEVETKAVKALVI